MGGGKIRIAKRAEGGEGVVCEKTFSERNIYRE